MIILAAFGYPEFIVEFNTLSIIAVLSQVVYSSFPGRHQFKCHKHELFCKLEPLKSVVAKGHSILGDSKRIYVASRILQFTVAAGHNI